jgi:hypothetical protein
MTTRLAALGLLALSLTACAARLSPQQTTDLAALDACASLRDAIQDDVRSEVEWSMREGYALPAIIGGMEVIMRTSRRLPSQDLPNTAPELWYVRTVSHPLGVEAAVKAGPRLTDLRHCLASKGYVFTDRSTTGGRGPVTKDLACAAEAGRAGADLQHTPAAFRYYVEECVKR